MYLLLLLLWIILNGKLTVEIFCFGVVIAGGIYWFMCKFLEYSPRNDVVILKNSWNILSYIAVLFVEVVRSGIAVLRFVLSPRIEIQPQIVVFRVPLQNDFLKTVLANSITLTPGTITVNVDGDRFYVHALDYTLAEGIEDSIFQRILLKIEENFEADGEVKGCD